MTSSPEFVEYENSVRSLERALDAHQQILRKLSLAHPGNAWADSVGDNFRLTKNALWESITAPTKELQSFDFGSGNEAIYDFDWS